MQTKKQNPLLAGLFFILALGFTVVTVISVIDMIEWFDYMSTSGILINIALVIGTVFVFCVPAYLLGAYFLNMGTEKYMHAAIRFSVSGWFILFAEVMYLFISTLIDYGFVSDQLVSVILTLLPLIITSVLYKKKDAYGNDLNAAKITSALYFLYLGLFNTIYKIAIDSIGSGALNVITFILSTILGLAIPGAFCYFYFKLEGKAAGNGAPAAYGQPQYGQPQYQQNPYQQQNPYGPQAPVPPVQQAPAQPQAPAAKFCPFCGAQMPAGSGFCTNCGGKLQ